MRHLLPLLLAVSACGGGVTDGRPHEEPSPQGVPTYPPGPYGINRGDVIEDMCFIGYAPPDLSTLVDVCLRDFYNANASADRPRALLLSAAAGWGIPSIGSDVDWLVEAYDERRDRGAEFVRVLIDGAEPGVTATVDDLDGWVVSRPSPFPTAIDPARQFASRIVDYYFPFNTLIDTSSMEVVEAIKGRPQDSFFAALDDLLEP